MRKIFKSFVAVSLLSGILVAGATMPATLYAATPAAVNLDIIFPDKIIANDIQVSKEEYLKYANPDNVTEHEIALWLWQKTDAYGILLSGDRFEIADSEKSARPQKEASISFSDIANEVKDLGSEESMKEPIRLYYFPEDERVQWMMRRIEVTIVNNHDKPVEPAKLQAEDVSLGWTEYAEMLKKGTLNNRILENAHTKHIKGADTNLVALNALNISINHGKKITGSGTYVADISLKNDTWVTDSVATTIKLDITEDSIKEVIKGKDINIDLNDLKKQVTAGTLEDYIIKNSEVTLQKNGSIVILPKEAFIKVTNLKDLAAIHKAGSYSVALQLVFGNREAAKTLETTVALNVSDTGNNESRNTDDDQLISTGQNVMETAVLGGALILIGMIAAIIRRKFL